MSLDQPEHFVKHQTLTRDAFLGGRLVVTQPGHGFRAGIDSVILGAAVNPKSTRLLDLGAGVGVAGMVALADLPALRADLAEIDEETLGITQVNLRENGLADRARALLVDVTVKGSERASAGLEADHYTSVIANPPYFGSSGTVSPKAGRATARHMDADQLALWVRAAAMHAAPGGEIIFVHVAQVLPQLLGLLDARFGALTVLPLSPRRGQDCSRILVRAIKGSKAPFRMLATRPLHEDVGQAFTTEFQAMFRGTGRLIW